MGPQLLPGTDLIGRAAEISSVTTLLSGRVRLLTLTGPPGVGKTRLAAEVADSLADHFDDGVAFVDLTPTHDRVGAVAAMARALGLGGGSDDRPAQRLYDWLADHRLLLILDNGEQVEGLADEVATLLDACPRLRILVTSRENLHLSLEHELPLPPLAMPRHDDIADPQRLAATDAVALFVAAAREVRPDFVLTDRNAEAVAEICIRLDGLPLALRLAGARTKMFSAQEIATRLRDRRAILEATAVDVPARHRSLRAAISWSHAVLDVPEQALFRRLAVFEGPWTLEAAEAVCASAHGNDGSDGSDGSDGAETVETLGSLVDKSLVQRLVSDEGTSKYRMLQSIHDFASEQLDLHGERAPTTARHLRYFISIAMVAEACLGSPDEVVWREAIGEQQADLSAALTYALETDQLDAALILTTAVAWDAYTLGDVGAGHRVISEVLERVERADVEPDPVALGITWIAAGVVGWARGDLAAADVALRRAVTYFDSTGDLRRVAIATAFCGHVARDRGQFDIAAECHQRVSELYDKLGNPRGAGWARFDLGRAAWARGDLDAAYDLLAEALTRFRDLSYPWAAAWAGWALGGVLVDVGQISRGAGVLASALRDFELVADQRGVASCLEALAPAAAADLRPTEAARMLGAADRIRQRLAAPLSPAEQTRHESTLEQIVIALGPDVAQREVRLGHELTYGAATSLGRETARTVEIGRHEPATDAAAVRSPAAANDGVDLLTSRERDVAALLVTGSSNQQIARRLGITTRTAEAHVHNIMVKLDARSRAEVAVWASMRDLAELDRTPD